SGSGIQLNDLLDYGLQSLGSTTSVAVTPNGCVVIGQNDGSILCLGTKIAWDPGIINSALLQSNARMFFF
ncbi:hypothetical protein PSY31_23390, partial [Shigella flexneri]|nr:hypothetical protein [Shigella flexneri]